MVCTSRNRSPNMRRILKQRNLSFRAPPCSWLQHQTREYLRLASRAGAGAADPFIALGATAPSETGTASAPTVLEAALVSTGAAPGTPSPDEATTAAQPNVLHTARADVDASTTAGVGATMLG